MTANKTTTKYILGVDTSTKDITLALLAKKGNNYRMVYYDQIVLNQSDKNKIKNSLETKLHFLDFYLSMIDWEYELDQVFIERNLSNNALGQMVKLGFYDLCGVVYASFSKQFGKEKVFYISNATWKKHLRTSYGYLQPTGTSKQKRQYHLEFVKDNFGLFVKDNDIADAILIAAGGEIWKRTER